MSVFDDVVIGEIETATKYEDVFENDIKTIKTAEYEGNYYYFSCGNIHPSLALFIPVVPKQVVDNTIKKLISKKEKDIVGAMNDCMSVLFGTNMTFEKYKGKGGARLLEKYSKQENKQEYNEFCNDVVLYQIHMAVFFNKNMSLWDIDQLKEAGLYQG